MGDPITIPVASKRAFMVGGHRQDADVHEWVASQLEPGDRIRVTAGSTTGSWGCGHTVVKPTRTFEAVIDGKPWYYDGLVLPVFDLTDIDHATKVNVHPEWDEIEVLHRPLIFAEESDA